MRDASKRSTPYNGLDGDSGEHQTDDQFLWTALAVLFARRKFILSVTAGVAVASVVITLLLPNWYAATARVLPPESNSTLGFMASLTRNLPSAASALLKTGSDDYSRYLTILTSRRMYEAVVDSFDLVSVYELEGKKHPREAAIEELEENVEYLVDDEYEFLSIKVLDTDPQRAADMANFIVRTLNDVNAELTSQSARTYGAYVERRYQEAVAATDSLMDAIERFQQTYGIFDVSAQTEGFIEQMADLRARAIQAEIQYEALRSQFGPDNPEVRTLQSAAAAANARYQNALAGQEQLLPVPTSEMSGVLRQYIELERESLIQARIMEVVRPMLEQARFDERRKVEAVQVVDYAAPPVKKAFPKRSIIVVVVTLSGLLLAAFYVLAYDWWRRRYAYVSYRLQQAVIEHATVSREVDT